MNKKYSGRWLLFFLIGFYIPHATAVLQARPMSPSVVLVLKLVSKTRVQPATGIVISNDGLVLVPAEFVSSKAEIIVLDGGTDIIKNGRPAMIVDQAESNGWAILSVKGLKRPGITLSKNMPTMDSELHFTAFPPAEYIANGLPPLWATVKIQLDEEDNSYSISTETPQPYVSGPILDDCGYLAGVSLTSGLQSLRPGKLPETFFSIKLQSTLEALQVKMPVATCVDSLEKSPAPVGKPQEAVRELAGPSESSVESNLLKPNVYNPLIKRKRLNPFQGASPQPRITEKPSIWRSIPIWLVLLGLIMLSALTWKAYFFFRMRKGKLTPSPAAGPVPVSFQTETPGKGNKPRAAPVYHEEMPDMLKLPEACNGVLVIDGFADPDLRFKRYCTVDTRQIDIRIGRHDTDIVIQHPSISSSHARFEKNEELMSLSDLGSNTGTYIKDVPCLEGEIMFFDAEDVVFLGDVQLRFSVINKDTAFS
jgi:hypothetical protein